MKELINEGISSIVYHFCPLSTMLQISETNKFILSSIESGKYESDIRMNSFPIDNERKKTYPYYMCFSRTPFSFVGYQYMRLQKTKGEWDNALVRLEIDGNALNARFKGAPVNFFTEKDPLGGEEVLGSDDTPKKIRGNKNSASFAKKYELARSWKIPKIPSAPRVSPRTFEMPRINRNIDYGEVVRTRMSEYEDRLFSNSPVIDQAVKYIKRVDILLNSRTINNKFYIAAINKIYTNLNGFAETYNSSNDKKERRISSPQINIYTDKVSFNSLNVQNAKTLLNKRYKPFINGKDFFQGTNGFSVIKYSLPIQEIMAICELMVGIAFQPDFTIQSFDDNIKYLIRRLGLDAWDEYDGVRDYSSFILDKCHNLLNNIDTYYRKNFNSWALLVSGFQYKHQGSEKIIKMFNDINKLANIESINFAKKYGYSKPVSIFSTLSRKYKIYNNNLKQKVR